MQCLTITNNLDNVSRFNHLQLPVLLDRLVLRRQYCLAIRISQYLKIPEAEGASRIVAHWACYKVCILWTGSLSLL